MLYVIKYCKGATSYVQCSKKTRKVKQGEGSTQKYITRNIYFILLNGKSKKQRNVVFLRVVYEGIWTQNKVDENELGGIATHY